MAIDPNPRRLHDLAPLRAGDGLERTPERVPLPGLHFDERDEVSSARHQIDLHPSDPEAMRHDVPAAALEVPDRPFLAGEATLVTLVGPLLGVTANPAVHGDKLARRHWTR